MKIVGMIPARMGSKRVKNKNLRLINGIPLIQYIVDAARESNVLNEIYINSESAIFSDIADRSGIRFYRRDEKFASDSATNDEFALDFMDSVSCDILVQLLPTSPFITPSEIDHFVQHMLDGSYETMISVKNIQIECIYRGSPINFNQKEKTPPSQFLEPIQAYACGLMAWDCSRFRGNTKKFGAAYHGGDGKIGFFELKGYSTIDIDSEDDFIIAEVVANVLKQPRSLPQYYKGEVEESIV